MNLDILFKKKNTPIFSRFNKHCWAKINRKPYFLVRKIKSNLDMCPHPRGCPSWHIYSYSLWKRIRYGTNKSRKYSTIFYFTWPYSLSIYWGFVGTNNILQITGI